MEETTPQQPSAETWEAERAQLTEQVASLTAELHRQRVHGAFYREAKAAGISDPDALASIVDMTRITFDDEGQAQGIGEILAGFNAASAQTQPRPIGGSISYANQPDKSTEQMLRQAGEKARSGRPEDMAAFSMLKRQTNKN